MKVIITLDGCDDSTSFDVDIPDEAYPILVMIANKSVETSSYGCMPTMSIIKKEQDAKNPF
jgi:hypothetical protein